MDTDAIVIGGGISGLACTWRLAQAGFDVLGLEASERPGGVIRSRAVGGFVVEAGPNTVQATPALDGLVHELELDDEVVRADPRGTRYLLLDGRLEPVPLSPQGMITSRVLSWPAKLRLLAEPFAGAAPRAEESVRDFFVRRFGAEVNDVLVAPLLSGTFAGDPAQLSLAAVFPSLVELERRFGSILWGALRGGLGDGTAGAARRLLSFRGGQERLPLRLAERLGERLRLGETVEAIAGGDGFSVTLADSAETLTARAVVLATSSGAAAALLSGEAADALQEFEAPPLACVSVAYRRDAVSHPLDGFGFLAPRGRGARLLGCVFASSIFPERAPPGWVALTAFLGGATDPEAALLSDLELGAAVVRDLAAAVGARGEPRLLAIDRYARSIPQYGLGHHQRVARIRAALPRGIFVAGNYLGGISVGDCIVQAGETAKAVRDFLAG